jgi:hypothetical protein
VGEHKTYNEFTIIRNLPAGSHVRLWLFAKNLAQPTLGQGGHEFLPSKLEQCSNYQLTVKLDVPATEADSGIRCEISTPIPESLNT